MKTVTLPVAYMPLVDAAPLIVAREMGFDEAEGLALDLVAAPSWSSVRDMLAFGRVDAAHLLSPVPVALALGLGGVRTRFDAVQVMSVNGTVIGVGNALADRLAAAGHGFAFGDPLEAAAALAREARGPLVIGAPFPFSMHVELLHYWRRNTALRDVSVEIRTIPPPLMAQALASGDIDAFCVGEPWGSVAVDTSAGALLLPGCAIWARAPEKVLAVRSDWTETEQHLVGRLMRAVWRAGRWLAEPDSRTPASELLARKPYLDLPAEVIDRALAGHLALGAGLGQRQVPDFVGFHTHGASFPWRSQAKWIAHQMSLRHGLDSAEAQRRAAEVFRSDIYRAEMSAAGAALPGASEKLEGAVAHETAVPAARGRLSLAPDQFFDRAIFTPSAE